MDNFLLWFSYSQQQNIIRGRAEISNDALKDLPSITCISSPRTSSEDSAPNSIILPSDEAEESELKEDELEGDELEEDELEEDELDSSFALVPGELQGDRAFAVLSNEAGEPEKDETRVKLSTLKQFSKSDVESATNMIYIPCVQIQPAETTYVPPPVAPSGPNHALRPKNGERILVPDFHSEDKPISVAEAERTLRELVGDSMNDEVQPDADLDVDDQAIIPGFKKGVTLLPHQVRGQSWMKEREDLTLNRSGGILADDMGLGKTVQALTRIVAGPRPNLVVCPPALLNQWEDELKQKTEDLVVIKYHGSSRTSDPAVLGDAHAVITTYHTLTSEYAAFRSSEASFDPRTTDQDVLRTQTGKKKSKKDTLFRVTWTRVILDEAHHIKNWKTDAAKACYEIKARYRWALTGTPIQNDVTDLFSLFRFLQIKPFSNWEKFNELIAKPIKSGQDVNRAMERVQIVLRAIMLRRLKDATVNDETTVALPSRTVKIVPCAFSPSERDFYQNLEARMNVALEQLVKDADQAGSGSKGSGVYRSILVLLLRLRQACNHPALASQVPNDDANTDLDELDFGESDMNLTSAVERLELVDRCKMCSLELGSTNRNVDAVGELCNNCGASAVVSLQRSRVIPSFKEDSAKIKMTIRLLKEIEERCGGTEKTIIFSQFTTMIDLVGPFLKENGVGYVRYDGSMKLRERERSLKAINEDPLVKAILMSFKAGSVGLNLTACNNVILLDPWWNPALEEQAFDRVHRLGQTRTVNVYKLKIDDTVEDRILKLQEKKRQLTRAALSGDKLRNVRMGMDEILALFRPGSEGGG